MNRCYCVYMSPPVCELNTSRHVELPNLLLNKPHTPVYSIKLLLFVITIHQLK